MHKGRSVIILMLLFALNACSVDDSHIIYMRINQAGYHTGDTKKAVIFSMSPVKERILLLDRATELRVEAYTPEKLNKGDWGAFKYYYTVDFSDIDQEGRYLLMAEKKGCRSQTFIVSGNPYKEMPSLILEFMRQQRCGYNPFLDVYCHQKDGRSMYGPGPDSSYIDVSGGWHDAGDQLKYLLTASYATAHMLKAFELFPEAFDDKVDESGKSSSNGIADILDEAKWGIDWIFKLHPGPDQLIHQVADDRDHTGWKMPDKDSSDYGWGPGSYRVAYYATGEPQGLREFKSEATGIANLAGRSAAAMAIASRIWREKLGDAETSSKCLDAAISLYKLGKQNEGYQQGNSYGAPYRYGEKTWADDMEWAAAELFALTSEKSYLQEAAGYAAIAGSVSWMEHDTASHYEFYPFVNIGHFALYDKAGKELQDELAGYYREGIEQTIKRAGTNPYNIGIPFIWCSNNLLTGLITQIILYEKMTGDTRYHEYLVEQRDWLFGRNPWGTSMFTGIPENGEYPVDVHTSIWALTGQEVPGGLVDGPVYKSIFNSLKGITLINPDEFAEVQNDFVVYHDDIGDYSTNEPTMDGTAGSLIMAAYFATQ
jgi:hypothetical protein